MVISKGDKAQLLAIPAFVRFLLDLTERGGLYTASSPASAEGLSYREGRRALVLEILGDLDEVQGVPNPSGIPAATSIQLLQELTQTAPKETAIDRTSTYADIEEDGAS